MPEIMLTIDQVAQLIESMNQHGAGRPARGGLLHNGWYSTEEVAELIDVDPSTLRRWRTSNPIQGPPFVRLTSRVSMYSIPDVEAWLASRRIVPEEAA
ncbi:helix-turn-helix domain-containing protein [Kitasatospora sp. NPDC093679]|uniref:helix-turn-helix transcriptional regulator n=1 Tax=Kitasatospora sp. NPDC093679 TaxID=3154983 RepID=UPI0034192704